MILAFSFVVVVGGGGVAAVS